jgi:hypothetical protein
MCAMNSMFEKRRGICTDCTEFGAKSQNVMPLWVFGLMY